LRTKSSWDVEDVNHIPVERSTWTALEPGRAGSRALQGCTASTKRL
jgi:hypothetical protein